MMYEQYVGRVAYCGWLRAERSRDLIPVEQDFSAPVQTGPGRPPSLLYSGYRVFPGGKSGRGVTLTPHPLLMPRSGKGRAIPVLPYGPYGLYRATVPVQGCTYDVRGLYKGVLYLQSVFRFHRVCVRAPNFTTLTVAH
jgi:hypothetical protein